MFSVLHSFRPSPQSIRRLFTTSPPLPSAVPSSPLSAHKSKIDLTATDTVSSASSSSSSPSFSPSPRTRQLIFYSCSGLFSFYLLYCSLGDSQREDEKFDHRIAYLKQQTDKNKQTQGQMNKS
jgi:hypothetical protein